MHLIGLATHLMGRTHKCCTLVIGRVRLSCTVKLLAEVVDGFVLVAKREACKAYYLNPESSLAQHRCYR